jgi:Ca2+-binding EF-hand superfamily protein
MKVFLVSSKVVSDAMLAELKQCFMEAYDDNRDGKIDIREVIMNSNIQMFFQISRQI